MSETDNKQRMRHALNQLQEGHAKAYVELFASDIRWTVIGSTRWSGTYVGKQELLERLMRPVSALLEPPFRLFVESMIGEGDMLVVSLRGENKTKSGKPYNNRYCWVCRMHDGQLREVTEYADTELFSSALI
jgi:ketosteroid isomerase-like protein